MKKIILTFPKGLLLGAGFWLLASGLFAQQIGMFSHYFYKPMVYNPAFTGAGDGTNIMLINHTQWSDFNGAPQLNIFTVDGNFIDKKADFGLGKIGLQLRKVGSGLEKVGLGFGLISDRKGINNRIGGSLFYSYRINISDDAHLAFGMSFGVINQSLDYSKAIVENAADPALFPDPQHKTTYDGNAGMAFVWNKLEAGAAVPQVFGNKINYADNASYTQARHYLGSLKYKFYLSEDKDISIVPQGLLRFVPNAPLQYDGNINFNWNNKFWIGATYKSNYAVAAHVGFCIHKQFSVGYSYDIITGSIGSYAGLSHEIMINIQLGKKPATANYLWIVTNHFRDFKDAKNNFPKKGFYVIVSKFHDLDSARAGVNHLINEGFKAANLIYYKPTNSYYVFIAKRSSKEEASKQVKNAFRIARFEDVWIQRVR
jgi:type IX secretion system PorP/SprF family membrane protein